MLEGRLTLVVEARTLELAAGEDDTVEVGGELAKIGDASEADSEPEPEPEPETTATDRTVTVAPGDTLWEIAARSLGPQASAPAVDAEWRLWYAANREVIGADPHLLLPGTRLEAPATGTGADR
mgnify:CR=1 FL=1